MSFDLLRRGEPDRVATGVVSPNFFDVLGIKPIIGRTFVETDDDEGAEAVLVLGHAYWQTQVRRRSRHRRAGVRDERPAAHRRRRAAAGAALSRTKSTSTCRPRPARSARRPSGRSRQNRRAFSALQVFGLLEAGASPATAATEVATVASASRRTSPRSTRTGRPRGFRREPPTCSSS